MSGDAGEFARQALRLAIVKVLKGRRDRYTEIESAALESMVAFTEGYIEALLVRTKTMTEAAGARPPLTITLWPLTALCTDART